MKYRNWSKFQKNKTVISPKKNLSLFVSDSSGLIEDEETEIKKIIEKYPFLNNETDIGAIRKHIQKTKMKIPEPEIDERFVTTKMIGKEVADMKTAIIEFRDEEGKPIRLEKSTIKGKEGKDVLLVPLSLPGQDKIKVLTCSATNWKKLIEMLGDETDKWVGQRIGLALVENNIGDNPLRISIRSER